MKRKRVQIRVTPLPLGTKEPSPVRFRGASSEVAWLFAGPSTSTLTTLALHGNTYLSCGLLHVGKAPRDSLEFFWIQCPLRTGQSYLACVGRRIEIHRQPP